jgi:hypothetical protein
MVQHAGELRVAVHTSSSELNQELRADLPELTKKLSDTGVHAELWRGDAHGATATGDASAAKNQGGNSQGGSQGNSQPGGSRQDRGQQGQNRHQQPEWVEQLKNGMQSAMNSTGETYGFRN